MSTNYDQLPSLEERVRASSIIVTGTIRSIKVLPKGRIGDVDEEQAHARITIDRSLKGEPTAKEIDVRFVRSHEGENRSGTEVFATGKRVVLMLVPDVGPDKRPDTYVAYLRGAFSLMENDAFTIETGSGISKDGIRKVRLTLVLLRAAVKAAADEEASAVKAWAKHEPELAKHPTLPMITELPEPGTGAGPISVEPAILTQRNAKKK
jgi:hypothetical protein